MSQVYDMTPADPEEGKRLQEVQQELQEKKDRELQERKDRLKALAKPGCQHCHGRGYSGTEVGTGKLLICRCAGRQYRKEKKHSEVLAAIKSQNESTEGESPLLAVERQKAQLKTLARTGCPQCHGEGYTGVDIGTGKFVICQCAIVTYGNLKMLQQQAEQREERQLEREFNDAVNTNLALGHTEHCAVRMAAGDGECECGIGTPEHLKEEIVAGEEAIRDRVK